MTDRSGVAVALLITGVALIALAGLIWTGGLSWFGRLPGDLRWERPGVRVYVPITSMILVSILLTLLLSIARKL